MQVTKSTIIVADVLAGDGRHVTKDMSLDVGGMNKGQFDYFMMKLTQVMRQLQ